jgi:hypothetical protein
VGLRFRGLDDLAGGPYLLRRLVQSAKLLI